MTVRTCCTCGRPEDRGRDDQGRETTNISPISGQCVDCLITAVRATVKPMARPCDAKLAQAGRDD